MQGIQSNDFDGLKNTMEMGFSSIVTILNTINDENIKTRKIVGSILDRLDTLSDNMSSAIGSSLGLLGIGSVNNYSKLSYKVQLDIFKTIKNIAQLQKKFIDFISDKGSINLNIDKPTEASESSNPKQGAFIGGKVINTQTLIEFNLSKADTKTLDSSTNLLKELNKFMIFKDEKFELISNFFKDIHTQLNLLAPILPKVASGFLYLSGALMLLGFVSIINVFKLVMILPMLGAALGLFIHAMVSAMKGIGGGIKGMWQTWMLMQALPDILLNMGKGIFWLSLGLVLFNFVGYEALMKFTIALIALGVSFKFMTDNDSWSGTAKMVIIIGLILTLTSAMIRTKDIKWDSVLKLPVALAGIGLSIRIGGFDKMGRIRIMNMIAIALLMITTSLIGFNYVSWENVIKYNVFISLLGLSLRTIRKDMPTMGVLALGFVALTMALMDFQELNWMSIIQIIGVVGLLGFVVNKFVIGRLASGTTTNNLSSSLSGGGFRGGGLIGFALGLLLLTFALERFAGIHWQSVLKAITIIAVLGIVFKLFFQEKTTGLKKKKKSGIQVPSMIGFALGLGLLVLALDAVTEIEWKSVFQLVTLMVAIGLIFKFLMPQKSKTSGILGFALGIGLLILALDAMSEIPWENVFKLVTFMTGIGVALWLIKGTGFFQMIAMAGAIYVMVYSLEYLSKIKLNANSMNAFLLFYGVVAVGLFFIGKFASKILLGAGIVLVIGWAAGVMANALAKISSLTFSLEGTLVWFGGVVLIGLAMAGIGALMMTGVGAILVGAGALAVLAIAGASLLMAYALSEISNLTYSDSAFESFSYGIGLLINAYIDLDPIATLVSVATAIATVPILLTSLVAIGVMKLIDYVFNGNTTLDSSINIFSTSLGNLINSFSDNISGWKAVKGLMKSVAILPILGTMFLASLLLTKISRTEWDASRLGAFNSMFAIFINDTVDTINKHKDALASAQPGIKSIAKLINIASSLANVVRDISSLKFVEMGVVDGKIVVTGVRQLLPTDFENVGNSIGKLILALIDPIKALGMDSANWRIGSEVIANPFKNDTFANGINNIKKITTAFEPLITSVTAYAKTGIAFDYGKMNRFEYSLKTTANTYATVFQTLAEIERKKLFKDASKTITAIQEYNDLWDDLDFDSFKDYSKLFNSFIDRLADAEKWKIIHKNISILTANLQKTVKAINSIDLEKAAALEVNVKQLSDKNNIQYIKEVIEEFANLFGIIGQSQYQNAMMMNQAGTNILTGSQTITQTIADKFNTEKNKEGYAAYKKIESGQVSLAINNVTDENNRNTLKKEYDSNNDGFINQMDLAQYQGSGMEDKLEKLIAILQAQNSGFGRK